MAGQYAHAHPDDVDGLVLWAAYPNGDVSAQDGLATLSIWGSLDASAARFGSDATRATLPPDARYVVIEGGNHEQMGDYTGRPDDPPATVSRDEQQRQVQEATIDLLQRIDMGPVPTAAIAAHPGCAIPVRWWPPYSDKAHHPEEGRYGLVIG